MKVSDANINKSKCVITKYLVKKLAERMRIKEKKAFAVLRTTMTYECLQDKKTYLYAESPEYVYVMLNAELRNDIESWLNM